MKRSKFIPLYNIEEIQFHCSSILQLTATSKTCGNVSFQAVVAQLKDMILLCGSLFVDMVFGNQRVLGISR